MIDYLGNPWYFFLIGCVLKLNKIKIERWPIVLHFSAMNTFYLVLVQPISVNTNLIVSFFNCHRKWEIQTGS